MHEDNGTNWRAGNGRKPKAAIVSVNRIIISLFLMLKSMIFSSIIFYVFKFHYQHPQI
jgi:hypothetical protein